MFQENDYVIYKKDVCQIKEIKEDDRLGTCYILSLLNDPSLKITLCKEKNENLLRKLMSKEEIEGFIKEIPNIESIKGETKLIEQEYRKLFRSEDLKDLVKVIKTAYERNEERLKNNKKVSEKDMHYFEKAEKCLYQEFSVVLGIPYEDAKNYVINKVKESCIEWKMMKKY